MSTGGGSAKACGSHGRKAAAREACGGRPQRRLADTAQTGWNAGGGSGVRAGDRWRVAGASPTRWQ
ncbi:hypothetical protein [Paenibacillus sp. TH7-28]